MPPFFLSVSERIGYPLIAFVTNVIKVPSNAKLVIVVDKSNVKPVCVYANYLWHVSPLSCATRYDGCVVRVPDGVKDAVYFIVIIKSCSWCTAISLVLVLPKACLHVTILYSSPREHASGRIKRLLQRQPVYAHSVYLSRIKMLIGTPEKSQFSRILFSKKRL